MPVGSISRYPIDVPVEEYLTTSMILDDTFVIRNVARETTLTVSLTASNKRMRPTPARRKQMPVKRVYTAQDICNKDEFEEFYLERLGKSVKMNFEGHTYYGYLSEFVRGEFDITFSYTHTSKIEDVEEDRLFPI